MTKSKIKELRDMSTEELQRNYSELQGSLRMIRFKSRIERPANPMEKSNLRKKAAVILTLINERTGK